MNQNSSSGRTLALRGLTIGSLTLLLNELQINNKLWLPYKIWLTTGSLPVNTPHPAYHLHSPCSIGPSPTQLITTPNILWNISTPIRLLFHCTLIPNHSMLSLIQPAHRQLLLNPFILLKHLHLHPKRIILVFPASSSHLNPTPRMGTSERHKGAQLRMTIILFLWEVMHNVQQQLNNMMAAMSPNPAPRVNKLIINNQLQHPGTQHKETNTKYHWYLNWQIMKIHLPSHLRKHI